MELGEMVKRNKFSDSDKEKVILITQKWESKISDFYHDSLWKKDINNTEKEFHSILEEWGSDVIRPVRRAIGACINLSNPTQNEEDELLDITAKSLNLFLQKIKICCEDFSVYKEISYVENLDYDNFMTWSLKLKSWKNQLEPFLKDFIRYANCCQLIFVQRAGRILGGLTACLQSYLDEYLNLNVGYIVDDEEEEANKKKRLSVGFNTIKLVNKYFQVCEKIGFNVVGYDEYYERFVHMSNVVKDLKKIFLLVKEDKDGSLEIVKEV